MFYPTFESALTRIDELESLLAAKGTKALKNAVQPQPLPNFYTLDGVDLLFKQLLKLHDAEQASSANDFYEGKKVVPVDMLESLGQIIIIATSYLEKIGCDESRRQLLFADLNRRFKDVAFTR